MRNQGDIDTQQIAGAVATGTHGSGTRYTSLSGVVRGVRLVTATGELRDIDDSDPDLLHAAQVHGHTDLELSGSFDHSDPPPAESWARILDMLDATLRSWAADDKPERSAYQG